MSCDRRSSFEQRNIVAVDLSDEKLALAKSLGATHVFNAAEPDLIEKVKQATQLLEEWKKKTNHEIKEGVISLKE